MIFPSVPQSKCWYSAAFAARASEARRRYLYNMASTKVENKGGKQE